MTREESLEPAGETSDVDANPAARVANPRLAHIVLSTAFIENHEPAQVQAYIDALVAAQEQAHSTSEDDLADGLRDRLDAAGVILPDESYRPPGLACGHVRPINPHPDVPHWRTAASRCGMLQRRCQPVGYGQRLGDL